MKTLTSPSWVMHKQFCVVLSLNQSLQSFYVLRFFFSLPEALKRISNPVNFPLSDQCFLLMLWLVNRWKIKSAKQMNKGTCRNWVALLTISASIHECVGCAWTIKSDWHHLTNKTEKHISLVIKYILLSFCINYISVVATKRGVITWQILTEQLDTLIRMELIYIWQYCKHPFYISLAWD